MEEELEDTKRQNSGLQEANEKDSEAHHALKSENDKLSQKVSNLAHEVDYLKTEAKETSEKSETYRK